MSDFHETTTPRARKRHCCDACCLDIEPGEVYSFSKGVFYGEFYTTKLHRFCAEICDKVENRDYAEGFFPDIEVEEWRNEFWRKHNLEELERPEYG